MRATRSLQAVQHAIAAPRPAALTVHRSGTVLALVVAALLTFLIPRLYPFELGQPSEPRRGERSGT